MAINVSVQHNGGFLPGTILLTQCYYHWGTRLNVDEVLYLQPMIPPKRFDIFPPDWGMLRRSIDAFRFFFTYSRFPLGKKDHSGDEGTAQEIIFE